MTLQFAVRAPIFALPGFRFTIIQAPPVPGRLKGHAIHATSPAIHRRSENQGPKAVRTRMVAVALTFFLEASLASGTVKWFNPAKGFGFIVPSDGARDVFVHISAVESAGLQTLN